MNDNILLFLWCLLLGAMLITLEILLVKWSNKNARRKAANLLDMIGFSRGNENHEYIKTVSGYTVILNNIPKERLFQQHSLRIEINFELPWDDEFVNQSLKNLKKKYQDYKWYTGHVHYEIYFLFLSRKMKDSIQFRIERTIGILTENGMNPITFEEAEKQFLAFEEWRKSNVEGRS